MSVRRSLFERLGTFDPLLGPGSPFRAGEESDLDIRAIAGGNKIINAAEITLLHLGVREGDEASNLMRGYGRAMGATLTKHVRLGTRESKVPDPFMVHPFRREGDFSTPRWGGARQVLDWLAACWQAPTVAEPADRSITRHIH